MVPRGSAEIAYVSRVADSRIPPEELQRRGARLKAWRELRGMSQPKLAELAETSQPQISNAEKGKRWFHADTYGNILRALRINEEQLLGDGPIEPSFPTEPEEHPRLEPKARVRRSWKYEDYPKEVVDAWERWDAFTHADETTQLDEAYYDDLLDKLLAMYRRGQLPKLPTLPGSRFAGEIDDPDAPKKS